MHNGEPDPIRALRTGQIIDERPVRFAWGSLLRGAIYGSLVTAAILGVFLLSLWYRARGLESEVRDLRRVLNMISDPKAKGPYGSSQEDQEERR